MSFCNNLMYRINFFYFYHNLLNLLEVKVDPCLLMYRRVKMTNSPRIQFQGSLSTSDPRKCPVIIVGQLGHLAGLAFSDVAPKLQPRVDEEVLYYYIAL